MLQPPHFPGTAGSIKKYLPCTIAWLVHRYPRRWGAVDTNDWCITLSLCILGNFASFFVLCRFFSKSKISKNSFRNTIRVSNSLDPDQARQNVGPDLGSNCLQRLAADGTSRQRVEGIKSFKTLTELLILVV